MFIAGCGLRTIDDVENNGKLRTAKSTVVILFITDLPENMPGRILEIIR